MEDLLRDLNSLGVIDSVDVDVRWGSGKKIDNFLEGQDIWRFNKTQLRDCKIERVFGEYYENFMQFWFRLSGDMVILFEAETGKRFNVFECKLIEFRIVDGKNQAVQGKTIELPRIHKHIDFRNIKDKFLIKILNYLRFKAEDERRRSLKMTFKPYQTHDFGKFQSKEFSIKLRKGTGGKLKLY